MRNNKNNITLNYKILISFLRNLIGHFTEKQKNITLSFIILILSLVNIILCFSNYNNTSALDYSSNVGIGFTFNPTLSVSLSSSDLVIPNLVPGSTLDSNSINVSVATNAAYGYTLSANVGDDIHNNSNLIHANNTSVFSSIATDANLSSLEDSDDSNIWGYSYKDNTVVSPAWNNYNGLSSSSNTILLDNSNMADSSSSVDFKIAAKASNTQPSGEYTGTINFIAVSKVAPMSLLDSFIASGAEQLNGYYKMQDMTHDICNNVDVEESELQLIDVRDNKVYWVAKLKDGNCWMTQNLDLDLSHEVALTSDTSDINPESYGTTIYTAETGYSKDEDTGVVSWLPSTIDNEGIQRANTIDMVWSSNTAATVPGWTNDNYKPYSADAGERYLYTNTSGNTAMYTALENCKTTTNDEVGCQHMRIGNYYNWPVAVASNNTTGASGNQTNSICPKNWNLPINGKYGGMLQAQNVWTGTGNTYNTDGYLKSHISPLYFTRSGSVHSNTLSNFGSLGYYWSSTNLYSYERAYNVTFSNSIYPNDHYDRARGFSIRCISC